MPSSTRYHLRMASQLSSTAVIVVATSVVSASTGGKDLTTVDIISKNDAQDVHKVDVSLNQPLDIGEECNTFISIENTKDEVVVDVGVLVDCEYNNQQCLKDTTSSLGGRCMPSKDIPTRISSQTISKPKLRFLQDTEGLECPANCPQSFCGCIETFSDFDIMKDPTCANEIKSVCSNDEVLTNCAVTDGGDEYSSSDYCLSLTCVIDAYAEGTDVEEC